MNNMVSNSFCTLILTYAICTAIKQTPISTRWLPLFSVIVGGVIGFLVGTFIEPTHLMDNLVIGAFGGANATWLDQMVKQLVKGEQHE